MTAKYRKLLKKHIACLICIIMMAASVPATVCAGEKADDEKPESIRVHITVENTVWTEADGAAWYGRLTETDMTVHPEDDLKDVIDKALKAESATVAFQNGQIHTVKGIAAGDAGNDCVWKYSINGSDMTASPEDVDAATGQISDGDRIKVYYHGTVTAAPAEETAADQETGTTDEEENGSSSDSSDDSEAKVDPEDVIVNGDEAGDSSTVVTETIASAQDDDTEQAVPDKKQSGDAAASEKAAVSLQVQDMSVLRAASSDIERAYRDTGDSISSAGIPSVGNTGGEWAVIGLVRSGNIEDITADGYYLNAVNYINYCSGDSGTPDIADPSDAARIILGITAAGRDASDVDGRSLTALMADMDYVLKNGVESASLALLALDSRRYDIPENTQTVNGTTREKLCSYILDARNSSGTWSRGGTSDSTDIVLTAQALQALAPYCSSDRRLRSVAEKALTQLSKLQDSSGSFSCEGHTEAECCAQIIIALTSMGRDPDKDSKFIKNGNSVMDALLRFYIRGSGFSADGSSTVDTAATEQAYNALTAYERFGNGKSSLYDMTDIPTVADRTAAAAVSELIAAIGRVTTGSTEQIKHARKEYDALSDTAKSLVVGYDKLTAAEKKLRELGREENNSGNGDSDRKPGSKARQITRTLGAATKSLTKSGSIKLGGDVKKAAALIDAVLDPEDPADRLPDDYSKLTDKQLKAVIDAYKEYEDLSDDDRLLVKNYDEFEKVLNKLGRVLHRDESSGITVSGLQWRYKLVVKQRQITDDQQDRLTGILGEGSELLVMYDISLIDVVTAKEYDPDKPVTVKIPEPDMKGLEAAVILHIDHDGRYEMIKCSSKDGMLVFDTQSFSPYGVAGFDGTWDDVIPDGEQQEIPVMWLIIGAAALAAVAALCIARKKLGRNDEK